MGVAAFIIAFLFISIWLFIRQQKFGKLPSGERLKKIQQSPHYKKGAFHNIHITPELTEGSNMLTVLIQFFFGRTKGLKPTTALPSIKTDLKALAPDENVLIWFGHSSYFIQADAKKILVDPVFSGSASPLPGGTRAFKGSDIYKAEDMPEIDFLFITHDHWDHLDYKTIVQLKEKIKKIICPLGVGAHFEYWGYNPDNIYEKEWGESVDLQDGFSATFTPARHFSGRSLRRNTSLWTSYVLKTPHKNMFLGGDSGYDTHFAEIGKKYGPFDVAILENGQYNKHWRYIHLLPEDVIKAATDINAKKIVPVHSGKFMLGIHPWDEPLRLLSINNEKAKLPIITPMIGEKVNLDSYTQQFEHWWEAVK